MWRILNPIWAHYGFDIVSRLADVDSHIGILGANMVPMCPPEGQYRKHIGELNYYWDVLGPPVANIDSQMANPDSTMAYWIFKGNVIGELGTCLAT